jgi:hypothetical protein
MRERNPLPRAPQRYCCSEGNHCNALQGPLRLRDSSTPSGQGSARQHTPQPLQGAPIGGLAAASGWIKMTCCCGKDVRGLWVEEMVDRHFGDSRLQCNAWPHASYNLRL